MRHESEHPTQVDAPEPVAPLLIQLSKIAEIRRITRPVAHPVAHHIDVLQATPVFAARINADSHAGQSCALPTDPFQAGHILDRLHLSHEPLVHILRSESPAPATT